jgi:very-short-patch-repair endonuclease
MALRQTIRNTAPELIAYARTMREEPTPAEAILWEALRGRRLGGLKFRRQHPINAYILDFWCPECRLVVELDGAIHEQQDQREHDKMRQRHLEAYGYTVLRFSNEEVLNNLPRVLQIIRTVATPFLPQRE